MLASNPSRSKIQAGGLNRASALPAVMGPGNAAVKPTPADQGAGSKRPMNPSSLLMPAGKRLAMPPLGGSLSAVAGRSPSAPAIKTFPIAAAHTAPSNGPFARLLSTRAVSQRAFSSLVPASASFLDPQSPFKKPAAALDVQGAPDTEQPNEPEVSNESGRKLQAPATALKIPDLPDLTLELPPPRSLARDFAGHNQALEQVSASRYIFCRRCSQSQGSTKCMIRCTALSSCHGPFDRFHSHLCNFI